MIGMPFTTFSNRSPILYGMFRDSGIKDKMNSGSQNRISENIVYFPFLHRARAALRAISRRSIPPSNNSSGHRKIVVAAASRGLAD